MVTLSLNETYSLYRFFDKEEFIKFHESKDFFKVEVSPQSFFRRVELEQEDEEFFEAIVQKKADGRYMNYVFSPFLYCNTAKESGISALDEVDADTDDLILIVKHKEDDGKRYAVWS